jgi:hypothetical protein
VKGIGIHRSLATTNIKQRHSVKKQTIESPDTEEEEEEEEEQQYVPPPRTGTGSSADTVFVNRLANSQSYSTTGLASGMQRTYQSYETSGPSTRDGMKNPELIAQKGIAGHGRSVKTVLKGLGLLLTCLLVPVIAYLLLVKKEEVAAVAPETQDELDIILDGMDGRPGVQ